MLDNDIDSDTPRGFKAFEVRNVEDVIYFLRALQDPYRFVYRGQSSANWPLETKIERDIPNEYKRIIGLQVCEQDILQRFKRRSHHHLLTPDIPAENDDLEWLALIQHYGGPTRLLDFTRSIFIGAHFAVGSLNKNECAAIWAVNQDYMMQDFQRKHYEHRDEISAAESKNLVTAAIRREVAFSATSAVEPFRQNRRLMQQQGLFVVPLDINQSFFTNLGSMFRPTLNFADSPAKPIQELEKPDEYAVIKFVIKKDNYPQFRRDLRQMNIATETLFPDLEGEARALADIVTNRVFVRGVV